MKLSKAHKWSGWPGAYCLLCGAEQALENALASNWFDPTTNKWKDPLQKQLVYLCDENCPEKMSKDEFEKIQEQCLEIEKQLKEEK